MKKKIYLPLILTLLSLTIFGGVTSIYKSPYEVIIPVSHTEWDSKLNKIIYKLNEEDRQLLRHYLERHNPEITTYKIVEQVPIGLSINRAIKIEKEYLVSDQATQDRIHETKKKMYDHVKASIQNTIFVTYLSKNDVPPPQPDIMNITYAVKNKGNIDISSVEGTVVFVDKQGTSLETLNIEIKTEIPASSTTTVMESYKKSSFSNFDIVNEIPSKNLDGKFTIQKITFKNGKTLTLPPVPRIN